MTTFDIYFNKGEANEIQYTEGDNVSLIEINNSDQEYYQSGRVIFYNVPSAQTIGDTVDIYINEDLEFSGYISGRNRLSKGVIQDTYNLVGKTYDLWRYHTNSDTTYTGKTSTYIASSLVGEFCSISVDDGIYLNSGANITNDIEFNNEIIGDALIRLSKLDGYRFYVDNNNVFHYEPYSDSNNIIEVKEDDILDMQPIEESDSDIVNDVLVVGGSDYSLVDSQTSHPHSEPLPDGRYVAQRFLAQDNRLSAIKLYLNRTLDPHQPTNPLLFEIWNNTEKTLFTDTFDNWNYLHSGTLSLPLGSSYNMQISGGYLCLAHDGSNYKTSGQILSYCYSGQYANEVEGYDCQYINLDISDVTSSNRIYTSGSNNSGNTWFSLTDNNWINLGDENYAPIIKYKFSSNGDYTPKIGTATLKISDASAGFEQTVFTDNFTNLTYISSESLVNMKLSESWYDKIFTSDDNAIGLSGMKQEEVPNDFTSGAKDDGREAFTSWKDKKNAWDNNANTLANAYGISHPSDWWAWVTRESNRNVVGFLIVYGLAGDTTMDDFTVQFSSTAYDWREVFKRTTGGWCNDLYGVEPEIYDWYGCDNGNFYYSGIRGVRYYWNEVVNNGGSLAYIALYDIGRIVTIPIGGFQNAKAKTKTYDLGGLVYNQVKIDVSEYEGDYITYSGSLDSGSNWVKLTKNEWNTLANTGKKLILGYYINASSNVYTKISGQIVFPQIRSLTAKVSTVQTGGIPKSGTKVEWSDDVSFSKEEIPYPPSYSSWQTYTDPKLRLTEGNEYWMILQHESGNSEYWTYYYDSSSTYDGKIAFSEDEGETWDTHSSDENVHDGNLCFKLGWKEGEITATSSNISSINTYGRHFKKITDSNITTFEEANKRASREVSEVSIPKKGTLTINGTTGIDLDFSLSSNLINFGINEKMDIISYTQRIDNKGFTTTINYGKPEFNISKKVADLERQLT